MEVLFEICLRALPAMIFSTAEKSVQIKEFSLTKRDFWHFIYPFHKEMGQIKLICLKESQAFRDTLHLLILACSALHIWTNRSKMTGMSILPDVNAEFLKVLFSYLIFLWSYKMMGTLKIILTWTFWFFFTTSTYYIGTSASILWRTLLITEKDLVSVWFFSSH